MPDTHSASAALRLEAATPLFSGPNWDYNALRQVYDAVERLEWDERREDDNPFMRRRQFTRTIAHQQALLQIYEDFCLQDNSDCEHCPFPEQMKNW